MKINGKLHVKGAEVMAPGFAVYTKDGKLDTAGWRLWVGEVTSDANGQFTVDWSAANFTAPPLIVNATAVQPATATVQDRISASMVSNYNSNNGIGYTTRGNTVIIGGATVRVAPSCKVHVMAWGRSS